MLVIVADNLSVLRSTEGSNFSSFLSPPPPFSLNVRIIQGCVLWNVTPCRLVDGCQHAGGSCCLIQSSCIYFVFGTCRADVMSQETIYIHSNEIHNVVALIVY